MSQALAVTGLEEVKTELTQLLESYETRKAQILKISSFFDKNGSSCLDYFKNAAQADCGHHVTLAVPSLINAEGALKSLDAECWNTTLGLTDVLDIMPQKDRDEWSKSIKAFDVPEFTWENIVVTMKDLLLQRNRFFAAKVEGVFNRLSPEHVTNSPWGFKKRMILAYVVGDYSTSGCGYINDLRQCIGKLLGRGDDLNHNSTYKALNAMWNQGITGEWKELDGGAIRVKIFKKGTAHLEVHPDMAWRLNEVLSTLHPLAIPAEHRKRPEKLNLKSSMAPMQTCVPFEVLNVLDSLEVKKEYRQKGYQNYIPIDKWCVWNRSYFSENKEIFKQVGKLLEHLGGTNNGGDCYRFDYDPTKPISHLQRTGVFPEFKSHQYYPTPECIAFEMAQLIEIYPGDKVLEPSAGTGGLLDFFCPTPSNTTCIEYNSLHCKVLEAKSGLYDVIEGDFLKWVAKNKEPYYDKIIMNPPFLKNECDKHLKAAYAMLKSGGELVCVLPAGKHEEIYFEDAEETIYSGPFENEFNNTTVSVTILKVKKI